MAANVIYDPWAQTLTGAVPGYVQRLPRIFPLRAEIPALRAGSRERTTLANLAERFTLAITKSPDPERIWVWARTEGSALAAARVMASRYAIVLEFAAAAQ
jgi:hypothetical protein